MTYEEKGCAVSMLMYARRAVSFTGSFCCHCDVQHTRDESQGSFFQSCLGIPLKSFKANVRMNHFICTTIVKSSWSELSLHANTHPIYSQHVLDD